MHTIGSGIFFDSYIGSNCDSPEGGVCVCVTQITIKQGLGWFELINSIVALTSYSGVSSTTNICS